MPIYGFSLLYKLVPVIGTPRFFCISQASHKIFVYRCRKSNPYFVGNQESKDYTEHTNKDGYNENIRENNVDITNSPTNNIIIDHFIEGQKEKSTSIEDIDKPSTNGAEQRQKMNEPKETAVKPFSKEEVFNMPVFMYDESTNVDLNFSMQEYLLWPKTPQRTGKR